jgi:hypothetical protein
MHLAPAAQRTLAKWHDMIARKNLTDLGTIIAESAIFRSPMANKPYPGNQIVCIVLRAAYQVLEDFTYHREFTSRHDAALEFSARVGDKKLKGIDLMHFDEAGLIAEFEVMVRPGSGLTALAAAMEPLVGAAVAEAKNKPL